MKRDLPQNVPVAVLAAAEHVLKEGQRFDDDRPVAITNYFHHHVEAHKERNSKFKELHDLAGDLFEWGVTSRHHLPGEALHQRFKSLFPAGPWISVINEEIVLESAGVAPGGQLRTELELCLFPDDAWLFRHHERFDGCRVTGGGQLNSIVSILHGLHPRMLRMIHERIAEGNVWTRVEYGLKQLLKEYKDG